MTAVLATAHLIRKVLQSEIRSMSGGDSCWLERRDVEEKKPVTRNKKP